MLSAYQNKEIKELAKIVRRERERGKPAQFEADLKARVLAFSDSGLSLNFLASKLNIAPSNAYAWRQRFVSGNEPGVLQISSSQLSPSAPVHSAGQAIEIRIENLVLSISQSEC